MRRIRRDPWEPYSHLELEDEGDTKWVWITLRGCGPLEGPARAESQILRWFCGLDEHDWEPWEPPEDVERIAVNWPTWNPTPATGRNDDD